MSSQNGQLIHGRALSIASVSSTILAAILQHLLMSVSVLAVDDLIVVIYIFIRTGESSAVGENLYFIHEHRLFREYLAAAYGAFLEGIIHATLATANEVQQT